MEIRFSEGGFCVAAHANGISEDRIERALEDNDLSRDPAFQSKLPTTGELWGRQEMGRAIAPLLRIRLCILLRAWSNSSSF